MSEVEFDKYAKEHNIFYCSKEYWEQIIPTVLLNIRDEVICEMMPNDYEKKMLEIIDKHIKEFVK